MPKYFIINGNGTSGKDTFVTLVQQRTNNEQKRIMNISTVDPIRTAFALNLGIDVENKTEELRCFMSETKALWAKYFDGPVTKVLKTIDFATSVIVDDPEKELVFFIHSREPAEISRFKDKFGKECKTILVDARGRVEAITSNESDKNVFDFDYDIVIDNSSTLDNLEQLADKFISEFI